MTISYDMRSGYDSNVRNTTDAQTTAPREEDDYCRPFTAVMRRPIGVSSRMTSEERLLWLRRYMELCTERGEPITAYIAREERYWEERNG